MLKSAPFFTTLMFVAFSFGQTGVNSEFKLALPERPGQLSWSAEGFTVIESSAKPGGDEIGIRAKEKSGHATFLGFLFHVSGQKPLTAASCRDGVLEVEKKGNPTLKIVSTLDNPQRVPLVNYNARDRNGKTTYIARGFVADGDICGDLEFYSDAPISSADTDLTKIFSTYRLDRSYVPKFRDALLYAQILYQKRMYKASAPVFETALAKLNDDPKADAKTMGRVVTDQAGMAYGMSGNIPKARAIFEKAITGDPEYPMYYYNLACVDAEEKNLTAARKNLQKAFDRKSNVIAGERMPDPTTDDSFAPYRNDKEFWTFLQSLRSQQ